MDERVTATVTADIAEGKIGCAAAALVDAGLIGLGGVQPLKEETVALMATPQVTACNAPDAGEVWGLGMRVILREQAGGLPAGSYGWSGAFGTHFWIDPVNEISGIYMKNSRVDGGAGASAARKFEKNVYASME